MTVSPQFNDELGHQTLLKHGKALMRKSWLKWMLWSVPIAYLFYGALAPLGLYLWWGDGLLWKHALQHAAIRLIFWNFTSNHIY
ncbi:MAG: hypothetical protein KF916_02120 [Microbacteriaceae bacterium]|nr:hypothetical protein [Microbacteriaceae bacterium]